MGLEIDRLVNMAAGGCRSSLLVASVFLEEQEASAESGEECRVGGQRIEEKTLKNCLSQHVH